MTNESQSKLSEELLHAYVDGELNPENQAKVEQYLQDHPEIAVQIQEFQAYNQGLQELFSPIEHEPIPDRLRYKSAITGLEKNRMSKLSQAAVVLLSVTVGATIGWFGKPYLSMGNTQVSSVQTESVSGSLAVTQFPGMVDGAFAAHAVYTPEIKHPVEVNTSEINHLQAWLSKRLKATIRAPKLDKLGFKLLGGRLTSLDHKPAAMLMYENDSGNRITLNVVNQSSKSQHRQPESDIKIEFQYASRGRFHGFYWLDQGLSYALIGDVERSVISKAAQMAYHDLLMIESMEEW